MSSSWITASLLCSSLQATFRELQPTNQKACKQKDSIEKKTGFFMPYWDHSWNTILGESLKLVYLIKEQNAVRDEEIERVKFYSNFHLFEAQHWAYHTEENGSISSRPPGNTLSIHSALCLFVLIPNSIVENLDWTNWHGKLFSF